MAKQNRSTLKGYFETGDVPSQAQYADLIDSKVNLSESNTGDISLTGNVNVTGNITASAGITSSGTINCGLINATRITDSDLSNGGVVLAGTNGVLATDTDITFSTDTLTITKITNVNSITHVTASGNISASHTSTGSFGSAFLSNLPTSKPTTTGSLWLSGSADDGTSKYLLVFTG